LQSAIAIYGNLPGVYLVSTTVEEKLYLFTSFNEASSMSPLFGGGLGEPLEKPKVVFGQATAEPVFQNAGDYVGEDPRVVQL
jgi:hypothetical protein